MEPRPDHSRVRVGTIAGRVYRVFPPRITFRALILAPVGVALASGSWFHLAGVPLVFLGTASASSNLNIGNGCLVVLAVFGLAVAAVHWPQVAVPLAFWAIFAWLAGSVECRLTMQPDPDYPERISGRDWGEIFGIRIFSAILLGVVASWLWWTWTRTQSWSA